MEINKRGFLGGKKEEHWLGIQLECVRCHALFRIVSRDDIIDFFVSPGLNSNQRLMGSYATVICPECGKQSKFGFPKYQIQAPPFQTNITKKERISWAIFVGILFFIFITTIPIILIILILLAA